jgi:large subunit ribosomal protein L24
MAKNTKNSKAKPKPLKLRKGDRVIILAGKDRGKEGTIGHVFPEKGTVIVDGLNVAKKHQKPTKSTMQGGIIDKEMPLQASNVAVLSPEDDKPTRVGYRFDADGTKVRVCRRTGADLP